MADFDPQQMDNATTDAEQELDTLPVPTKSEDQTELHFILGSEVPPDEELTRAIFS